MGDKELKENLYHFCSNFAKERVGRIQSQINEVQSALESETKSSAGDKHETGRAMLQLEREKLGLQLAESENLERLMQKVDILTRKTTVSLGSLVKTTMANYFLAISAGEFKSDATIKNYCISPNTPIGIMLLGKRVGQTIRFNNNEIEILEIG